MAIEFLNCFPPKDPYPLLSECVNCGKIQPDLTWSYDWCYWACDDCAAEAELHATADRTCPNLFVEVCECKTVKQIQEVMRSHTCPMCAADVELGEAA